MRNITVNRVVTVLAVVGVVSILGVGARALTSLGSDKIRAFEGVQVGPPDIACTTSFPNFEPMPDMSFSFDTGGGDRVLILFQGQFGASASTSDARAVIRFSVDGVPLNAAGAIGNDHGTGLQTFGYNAFTDPLAPGPHTVDVLWHTAPSGATSCVEERSLVVLKP